MDMPNWIKNDYTSYSLAQMNVINDTNSLALQSEKNAKETTKNVPNITSKKVQFSHPSIN